MNISELEICEVLLDGSGFSAGKLRIYKYFCKEHTIEEYKKFLKNEYGIGGWSGALKNAEYSSVDHYAKGIKILKKDIKFNVIADIFLKWNKVAIMIKRLVNQNIYLSQKEKVEFNIKDEPENLVIEKDRKNVITEQLSML
ncbi:hypothetical protein [Clostridium botulinum]|uniref:Uncharacterized protein n=1 Tax=Clostridium botulinum TaxID=1491 RepID=A0A9Q1ZAV3_CLOBO|nr:hypothetical protein [Clostridium botulinum]AEB75878.1 hypothetical protein CbC4_1198 [Clostridium botulinum BKT015925]KEH97193.1 hypothetical protein Z953_02540 [Clostridium botulinum D str. 16868]KEI04697.1 hypothetical protein Y848_00610 [Clostridium botulinum C/D str. Sp77]KLU76933.1 hypothetical protein CBC3_01110 [Clostridium botulinum V891]KOA75220.1 hypothetical protein ADU78_08515 [Clostridium botulinum]